MDKSHSALNRPSPDLYPRIDPFAHGYLDVSGGHRIYWEQSGNPEGVPVIFLHGGPGAGTNPSHRRFFDPDHYRIILFDQRGSGKSTPFGKTEDNTTPDLIADMESLRKQLNIDSWFVFGGSWGSTLALAYGVTHPDHCRGFALRGIFLGRKSEVDWFLYGMQQVFPESWRRFSGHLPEDQRDDILTAYHKLLLDPEPEVHRPAAEIWSQYESACSTLYPIEGGGGSGRGALSLARMEAHYFVHDVFLPDDHLLTNVEKIRHLPCVIVQGRYDMVCPIATADELARAWPEAQYVIIPDAGHSAMEPGIRSALVKAMDGFRR